MNKLKEVFLSYKNLLWENAESERIAEEREKICEKCDKMDYMEVDLLGKKWSFYLHCTDCKCYVPAILRDPVKKCDKWKE